MLTMQNLASNPAPLLPFEFLRSVRLGDGGSRSKSGRRKRNGYERKIGNRVLLVGLLRELALYRAEVLKREGFTVTAPESVEQAIRILSRRDFDAVVLSYTLPNDAVEELTEIAREHCPDCPVIAIAEGHTLDRRIKPDAVALASGGPSALITALNRVLKTSNR
jgi:CheY-like chemotaxis protein